MDADAETSPEWHTHPQTKGEKKEKSLAFKVAQMFW